MITYQSVLDFWHAKNITSAAQLSEALNAHCISFAYNSGKLENDEITYHDTREVFERDEVTAYTGNLRTLFEIRNSKTAYEYMLDVFDKRLALDEAFIKEVQRLLTENTYDKRRWELGERPGEYKKHDYVTGSAEIGASADEVSEEMNELLCEMDEIDDKNALTAAAYFHVKFENIHPFADGNGRTGRLAMNYFLLSHSHPPIVIHEEDRKAYYAALEAWDNAQELNAMLAFLKAQTIKTWEKQLSKTDTKTSLKDFIDIA